MAMLPGKSMPSKGMAWLSVTWSPVMQNNPRAGAEASAPRTSEDWMMSLVFCPDMLLMSQSASDRPNPPFVHGDRSGSIRQL